MVSQQRRCRAELILAALLALLATLPATASAQTPLAFGAHSPSDPYNVNTSATDALEATIARRVDIVHWYQNWGSGEYGSTVQRSWIDAVVNSGRIPLLTWEPWNAANGVDQPEFRLARLAAGDFDAYITTWADGLKEVGSTIYLRPMHEMNGDWYPWGGTVNANTPSQYVMAWRRMVDIFRQRGASNVRWVWSPSNFDVPASNLMEDYYPGTSYVDVLAADIYNWGSARPQFGGWQTFAQVFSSVYDRLSRLGPQPIWVAEVGCAPDGGDKATWIRDMFAQARNLDRLQAIVWFNAHKELDWRAAPTPDIAAAFAAVNNAVGGGTPVSDAGVGAGVGTVAGVGAGVGTDAGVGAGTVAGTVAGVGAGVGAGAGAGAGVPAGVVVGAGTGQGAGPGDTSSPAAGKPSLVLRLGNRARAGRMASVRWTARRANQVKRWHAFLDGRRVRVLSRDKPPALRKRVHRAGRHRWTIQGRDHSGRMIVSASRSFRVG